MNRMKRLSPKDIGKQEEMRDRVKEYMRVLAGIALTSMDSMNGKQVGLAVNAVCGQGKDFLPLMRVS
jgi:hypothetical protein